MTSRSASAVSSASIDAPAGPGTQATDLTRHAENEATRLAVIRELLDRGFGRPTLYADVKSDSEPAPRNDRELTDEERTVIILPGKARRANGEDPA